MGYAEGTKVSVEKSKADIEQLLRKHGATQFQSGWDADQGVSRMTIRMQERIFRFDVWYPDIEVYRYTEQGRERSDRDAEAFAEKEHRRRWRARLLIIKAKLEMIESGESSVEEEFMADLILPDGSTMRETFVPKIEEAYATGKMPSMTLPALPEKGKTQ
jgi:hypothetical protein